MKNVQEYRNNDFRILVIDSDVVCYHKNTQLNYTPYHLVDIVNCMLKQNCNYWHTQKQSELEDSIDTINKYLEE